MRTKNSIKNILTALIGQGISVIIGFISIHYFYRYLGVNYLGLNSLFINIMSTLSLAELGIGNAILYSMYNPVAKDNKREIKELVNIYGKIYRYIGVIILIIGIIIVPFLKYFTNGIDTKEVSICFILFTIYSSLSYFATHKRTIIFANQKNYIISTVHYIYFVLVNIIQIFSLSFLKSYKIYIIIQILFLLLENLTITIIADKMFPFIKGKNKELIDMIKIREIAKNAKDLFLIKVGRIIIQNEDNIIISLFLGLSTIGIYSNYILVTNAITNILKSLFNGFAASIANFNITKDSQDRYNMCLAMITFNLWIVSVVATCLYFLLDPFITMWIGKEALLDKLVIIMIVVSFFIEGTRIILTTYRETEGLFNYYPMRGIYEAILNLILSIIFIKFWGLAGIKFATIVSAVAFFWIEPYIMHKYFIKEKMYRYFKLYGLGIASFIFSIMIINKIKYIFTASIIHFLIQGTIIFTISNLMCFILFCRTQEFNYIKSKLVRSNS